MTKSIKQRILDSRGVVLEKHTRTPLTHDDAPSLLHKTYTMKWLEIKHTKPIEELITSGTLSEVSKRLGVDRTTISKWRTQLALAKLAEEERNFWKQFGK